MNIVDDNIVYGLIGANMITYGHFESYIIPYPDNRPVESECDVTLQQFLQLTYNYYYSSTLLNLAYGDDLKEQNSTKSFIRTVASKRNRDCIEAGKEWCSIQNWKIS